jgi:hypothetical protein
MGSVKLVICFRIITLVVSPWFRAILTVILETERAKKREAPLADREKDPDECFDFARAQERERTSFYLRSKRPFRHLVQLRFAFVHSWTRTTCVTSSPCNAGIIVHSVRPKEACSTPCPVPWQFHPPLPWIGCT